VSLDGQYRPVPEALILGLKARCNAEGVFHAQHTLFCRRSSSHTKGAICLLSCRSREPCTRPTGLGLNRPPWAKNLGSRHTKTTSSAHSRCHRYFAHKRTSDDCSGCAPTSSSTAGVYHSVQTQAS
jgi:hypothetical protein